MSDSDSFKLKKLPSDFEIERMQFETFLKGKGLKLTKQRKIIFDEVFRHHGHLDADSIAERLRSLGKRASRATVYRTLDLLSEAGLVKSISLGKSQHYHEHVHEGEHHDHLVCVSCHKIIEFYSDELENTQDKICREYSFKPVHHTMIVFGTCSKCRQKGD